MNRVRPDLGVAIFYVCTRITKNNEDNWKKLRRLITWIRCTTDDHGIIGASILSNIFTWIDTVYALSEDMTSQTEFCKVRVSNKK